MSHGACIPLRVHTVVVSVQHSEKIGLEDLRQEVMDKVIKVVIPEKYLDERTTFHINPCGLFVVGGPMVSSYFRGGKKKGDFFFPHIKTFIVKKYLPKFQCLDVSKIFVCCGNKEVEVRSSRCILYKLPLCV